MKTILDKVVINISKFRELFNNEIWYQLKGISLTSSCQGNQRKFYF